MPLRAIVIGSGWAGEGHTLALQAAGVDVVALCGRNLEATKALALKCGISNTSLDWRSALHEFRPDIVSIGTPAAPHHEMAIAAVETGCHVVCDKPLAVTAAEAREIFAAAQRSGVKTCYGATGCYGALYIHTRNLIADGLIGKVREIEYHIAPLPFTLLYSWAHQLIQGGGLLNNVFTHQLQQVLFVIGGNIISAMGTTSHYLEKAPLLPGQSITDWRQTVVAKLTPEQAATAQWRTIDVDFGYKVLLQIGVQKDEQAATALFTATEGANYLHPNNLAFHGTRGTLYLLSEPTGYSGPVPPIKHFDSDAGSWNDITVPDAVSNSLPQVEDGVQRQWNQLFKEFVADVRGEGFSGYPTFRDGLVATEVIEIVRSGKSWTKLPQL